MTAHTPRFGNLLTWKVLDPGQEHAVTYNSRSYRIERASRETVRARFGHGGAGWFLHSSGQMGFGEVDGNWEWGYPLAGTVPESRMLAELKLVCPWVIPTCTTYAPSITQILRGLGAVGDVPDGPVMCELVTPTEIQIRSGGGSVATVRICLNVPPDPAVASIGCVWLVEASGWAPVECGMWPEAFEMAVFVRSDARDAHVLRSPTGAMMVRTRDW